MAVYSETLAWKINQPNPVFTAEKEGLEEVKSLVVDATPVKVAWHSKINQV